MNPKDQIPKPEESLSDELEIEELSSVDDFIRELEAKEKDLHITSDLTIEVEQSEFDTRNGPDLVPDAPSPRPSNASNPERPRGTVEPGMKTRVFELEREVEALNERIRGLKSERHDIQEKSDRRLKDFENFKYRMDRERRGAFIDQIANLAGAMLPVVDNLDRALVSVEKLQAAKSPEFQQFYDGIALVNQQVNEVLGEMGVEPIKTVGETFDPQFHEAVATEQRDDVANNTISEEMLRGYRIGNRVVRHSMVKVTLSAPSSKPEKADPASVADPTSTESSSDPVE
ncbi:MAG TPA: nucleotide exchange factor GrpE [Pyrinomonadaceae bacterium]|jgi:molecular chaperone GrpE|nr:nucleotide exchange factor GrpE [Pyrinomonadaceae bacterium]